MDLVNVPCGGTTKEDLNEMFTRALVRPPAPNFASGLTTVDLGVPDYERALLQHRAYCDALEHCGVELTYLNPDDQFPDSTFVEDTAVLTDRVAITCSPGAPSRKGEVDSIGLALQKFYSDIWSIAAPGTLDGGDVCEAGEHFFIGLSQRTNEYGAMQLQHFLSTLGFTSSLIDIRPLNNILHLKSGLAFLGESRLVLIDELFEEELFGNYERIFVQPEEAYAANCIRVNDRTLIAAGFPQFEVQLKTLGYNTLSLEMSEFQKMDGGLSCLSLRF